MEHLLDDLHDAVDLPSGRCRTDPAGARCLQAGEAVAGVAEAEEQGAYERELCCMWRSFIRTRASLERGY